MNATTTAAHTPGPWTVRLHDARSFNGAAIIGAGGLYVASIPRKADRSYEQKAADVRLIAAAPTMLAALKKLIEKHIILDDCGEDVRAAIAKAEGHS